MTLYAERLIRLREKCEGLRILLGFSLAANGVLAFFLVLELIR